jgi:hypothetical protein
MHGLTKMQIPHYDGCCGNIRVRLEASKHCAWGSSACDSAKNPHHQQFGALFERPSRTAAIDVIIQQLRDGCIHVSSTLAGGLVPTSW